MPQRNRGANVRTWLGRRRAFWLWAAAVLCLTGCTVGPDYHTPTPPAAPPTWSALTPPAPATQPAATQPSVATTQPFHLTQWWATFNDATLTTLVNRAVASNLGLQQAESRIRQARAVRSGAAAAFWPTANATGSFTRTRTPGAASPLTSPATTRNFFQAGLDATWELDIFGGVRRDIEAAEADTQAAIRDRQDVLVSLVAEVALNYIDLRGYQQQIVIARRNLAAQQRTAELTRKQFRGGIASALDVANADAQVATTQAQIPALESLARQTIFGLSVLLAQPPAALEEELTATAAIPTMPPQVPAGLPSDLLRRRPDIRRAEEQLHAATARIGVATADLFPKFSLTGNFGFQSSQLASLGSLSSRTWSFGPSVTWAILNTGQIQSNIDVQKALTEQALLAYQQTVLTALQDVESALVAYAKEQERRQALRHAVVANRKAVELSTLLYSQGQTDFLNVLTAQRALLVSEDALTQSDRTVATNLVALYKALGGGWEAQDAVTQPAPRGGR